MVSFLIRSDLAVQGIQVRAPVSRHHGAGPTGDCHLSLDGVGTSIPINNQSPYTISDGRIWHKGNDIGVEAVLVQRPLFYDERTTDGIEMHRLARLHGKDVLATTVVQTCVRYVASQRCKYCSIEESYNSGATTRVKTPQQLAEVAQVAVSLDGVKQMVMTTGTSAASDLGARHLARCVKAVKQAVPNLRIQVQCEPPQDLSFITHLRQAGADSIGIHVESLDDKIRQRWLPGKATVPLINYWDAWDQAIKDFGTNQVSTYLLIGLGENSEQIIAWAKELISHGVYPFVVPVRPGEGTIAQAEGLQAPSASTVAYISSQVSSYLAAFQMDSKQQQAGCVSCGACSALNATSSTVSLAKVKIPINSIKMAMG